MWRSTRRERQCSSCSRVVSDKFGDQGVCKAGPFGSAFVIEVALIWSPILNACSCECFTRKGLLCRNSGMTFFWRRKVGNRLIRCTLPRLSSSKEPHHCSPRHQQGASIHTSSSICPHADTWVMANVVNTDKDRDKVRVIRYHSRFKLSAEPRNRVAHLPPDSRFFCNRLEGVDRKRNADRMDMTPSLLAFQSTHLLFQDDQAWRSPRKRMRSIQSLNLHAYGPGSSSSVRMWLWRLIRRYGNRLPLGVRPKSVPISQKVRLTTCCLLCSSIVTALVYHTFYFLSIVD